MARSRASSRLRCAIRIENVLMIKNVPTINDTAANTSKNVLRKPRILSIVFCCIPIAALALGVSAITMANSDLEAMRRGLMDPAGEGATTTGKTCGIVGLVLTAFVFVGCCLVRLSGGR